MSKSNYLENGLLKMLFTGGAIANICDNASTSPLTKLYVSLHTDDPGEDGDQTTNEVTYDSYARVAVNRDATGWTVSGGSVSPVADITFPAGTGGSGTATHMAVGTDSAGAGNILYSGALNPTIVLGAGVTPRVTKSSTISED